MKFTQLEYIWKLFETASHLFKSNDRQMICRLHGSKVTKDCNTHLVSSPLDRTTDNFDLNSDNVQKSAEPTKNEI